MFQWNTSPKLTSHESITFHCKRTCVLVADEFFSVALVFLRHGFSSTRIQRMNLALACFGPFWPPTNLEKGCPSRPESNHESRKSLQFAICFFTVTSERIKDPWPLSCTTCSHFGNGAFAMLPRLDKAPHENPAASILTPAMAATSETFCWKCCCGPWTTAALPAKSLRDHPVDGILRLRV